MKRVRTSVVALMVGLIAACNGASAPVATRTPPTTQQRQILCEVTEAHLNYPIHRSDTDVVVEPIGWPNLKTWANADPRGFATNGALTDFKIGAEVRAGATVTVSVAPEARVYAGLDYGQAWSYSSAPAITFHSCANSDTAFVGGFHIEGRRCVPFDVTPDGKPPVRIVVSFFNSTCAA